MLTGKEQGKEGPAAKAVMGKETREGGREEGKESGRNMPRYEGRTMWKTV